MRFWHTRCRQFRPDRVSCESSIGEYGGDDLSNLLHFASALTNENHEGKAVATASDLNVAGANINAKDEDDGDMLLHRAAVADNAEDASALIAAGADIHAKNNIGEMPLEIAVWRGWHAVATVLRSRMI